MKKSNDFDNIIYKYYKENNQVPQKITEAIWDVELKSKKKKISYFTNVKKVAITIISIIKFIKPSTFYYKFIISILSEKTIATIFSPNKISVASIDELYFFISQPFVSIK